jgi:peptidyl-prolyl cis-trans isomerase NIMA-interacting 1
MSNSRRVPYFYHAETQESSWDKPGDLTDEEVKKLPGYAEHIGGASGDKPARVRASHLLVKHNGSRRPSSWKEVRLSHSVLPFTLV